SPAARAELERRLKYYHEEVDASFNPPRPGLSDSLREVITRDHAGTTAEEERAKREEQIAADEAKRKAFFEKIQAQGRAGRDRGGSQIRGTRGLPPSRVTTSGAEDNEATA